MNKYSLLFPTLLMGATVMAQPTPQGNALQAAKRRIASITRDHNTRSVQQELDRYVSTGFAAETARSEDIQAALTELLSNQPEDPEHSGKPYARVADLRFGKSLVTAYMLARGGEAVNDSSVTIRGYKIVEGKYQLTATTGSDLDGYGLFTHELESPVSGESWLFVWGPQFGFNGTKMRMRVFAFDGATFRTIWAPDDMYSATVHFTSSGFTIDHLDMQRLHEIRNPPYRLRDEYILTVAGPQRQSSAFLPE